MKKIRRKNDYVGFDIGINSIKVVALNNSDTKPSLFAYNIKKVPKGTHKNSSKLEKLIKDTLKEVELKPDSVNLSLSGANVIVRFIRVPKMSKEQLDKAMVFEAEKYIPFNVDEVVLDSCILDDVAGSGQMNIILAAVKRDYITKYTELFQKMGIRINLVDINSFAIFNAYQFYCPDKISGVKAFMDMGDTQTSLLISSDQYPRFMRSINIGGKDISKALMDELTVDILEAERIMTSNAEEDKNKILQAAEGVFDKLAKEIQLSFSYFTNKNDISVSEIFCSGGLVFQNVVIDNLRQRVGKEMNVWNPTEYMGFSDGMSAETFEVVASHLVVALGTALRA